MVPVLFDSNLKSLPLIHRGKVRDIYAVDDDHMLIVTTDRLSAFDVVLPTPIPGKGAILTNVSNFWFDFFAKVIPSQVSTLSLSDVIPNADERNFVEGRAIVVKKLNALPIEAIVRGYIIGSGWKDYQANGSICGITLPENLQLAEKLPEAIYTPSSKAAVGEHDENIDFSATVELMGNELAEKVKQVSLQLYTEAAAYALPRGIIIADTKFEFGVDSENNLTLIDEVLTPDSSRFWSAESYQTGVSPKSFDKQYVRDYLETLNWNKTSPGPELPDDIVHNTSVKYTEAFNRLKQSDFI
jgi:phosphoribosylaminoimidazole-succinocarboxamide synthase